MASHTWNQVCKDKPLTQRVGILLRRQGRSICWPDWSIFLQKCQDMGWEEKQEAGNNSALPYTRVGWAAAPCRTPGWAGRYWIWECSSFFVHYPAKSLISVFQIWTQAFHPPTRMFGAHLNTSKLKCYISIQWKLVCHKEGNMNETSSAFCALPIRVQFFGKAIVNWLRKDLFNSQMRPPEGTAVSKKKFFFFF